MSTGWSGTAEAYDRSFAQLCAGAIDALLAGRASGDGEPALDVGTGTGSVIGALLQRGYAVSACDQESSMVEFAAGRYPEAHVLTAALPELPYADGSFALTTANFVINHVAHPLASAHELLRVTRGGGTVAATIWPARPVGALNQFWNRVMESSGVSAVHAQRLPPDDDFPRSVDGLRTLLLDAGAADADCLEVTYPFRVRSTDLWSAVTAGIATIGQTYRAQTSERRRELQAAFSSVAAGQAESDVLAFESRAIVVRATAR